MPDRQSRAVRQQPLDEREPLASAEPAEALSRRAIIEHIRPEVDGGRFPIKRTPGEAVVVLADIFADGHDVIAALLRDRPVAPHAGSGGPRREAGLASAAPAARATADEGWRETPMTLVAPGTDEWTASFEVGAVGFHEYSVVAWSDRFGSWRHDLRIKAAAGQDLSVELVEGALMIRDAAARAARSRKTPAARRVLETEDGGEKPGPSPQVGDHASWLLAQADALDAAAAEQGGGAFPGSDIRAVHVDLALSDALAALMAKYADRSSATTSKTLRVRVDRERARFGAWYEMFPRSAGPDPTRSATFREAARRLSAISDLGFDIVYLPPVHPIGRSFRKGPNNSLVARPGDPGSPWAIGSEEGGHTAIEPGLGTFDDFEAFRVEAERVGLEVALDIAWQCSPDHPWVREHPEWFRRRPDGTIKYAENPPKKYQDIYPFDFACDNWRALWNALLEVTLFWVSRGVRVLRIDNPHTKTFGFWEWLIARVHERDPGVIFLSEAFTRPKLMRYLAKAGFTQSYTYFTWRNTKQELTDYFTELTSTDVREYLRPNLFTNTPDILHAYLQSGGPPAFQARLLLAATLGAAYGIYSGFELCEGRAVPGSEEYADSEKYQYRQWDWERPGHIKELIARVNAIRRQHPALQYDWTLRFQSTDNPNIIAYSKSAPDGSGVLLTVVNLDPHHMQHGFVQAPLAALPAAGAGPADAYTARDLLDGTVYRWRGEYNYVRLDPHVRQGHIFTLEPGG